MRHQLVLTLACFIAATGATMAADAAFKAPDDAALKALFDAPQSSSARAGDLSAQFEREMAAFNRQLQTNYENARRSDALAAEKRKACIAACNAAMDKIAADFKAKKVSEVVFKLAGQSWMKCKAACFK